MAQTKKAPAKKAAPKKVAVPKILGWGTPPPSKRKGAVRGTKYQPVIDELIANPGKVAKVMENANTASAEPFRQAGCRLFTRQVGDGSKRVDIWAVYDPDGTFDPKASDIPARTKKAAAKPPAKKVAPAKNPAKKKAAGLSVQDRLAKRPRPKAK